MDTPSAASLRLRLEAIDADTALLHSKLAELAAARRVIVQQLKCITFPAVVELPVELTSKIFVHYAQEHIDIGKQQLTGPFVLASVCQHWRTIALGLHQLWSRIALSGGFFACQERRLQLCLERSGTFVDLDIDFAHSFSQQGFLPSLAASAERLSRLDMFAGGAGFKEIRGRLPRLRTLKLWNNYSEEEENLPILAFDDAPMLREVKLVGIGANMLALPWAQLVYLDLESDDLIGPLPFVGILGQAPNLETLCLHIPNDPLPLDQSAELRLERLQTLTLTWSRGMVDAARSWMNLLTLPALVDFTTDLDDDPSALRTMLTRSECGTTLRCLTLNTKEGYTGQIKSILTVIPFLTKLTMTEIAWNELDNLFYALGGDPTADGCTIIHELRLETNASRIPYPEIARFVSSRASKPIARPYLKDHLDTGLRRLDVSISGYGHSIEDSDHHPEVLDAVEKLQSIASCPGMPELNIIHKDSFVIQSSHRKPPPMHTLSD